MEIERKFLVVADTGASVRGIAPTRIRQGYLSPADPEVRLRARDGRYYLTAKKGSGLSRAEAEIEITGDQFDELWPMTEGARLEKNRYEIGFGEYVIELDVYDGALSGLVVAEVEFESVEASRAFAPPDWFGADVTGDDRYGNRSLAVRGAPEQRTAAP